MGECDATDLEAIVEQIRYAVNKAVEFVPYVTTILDLDETGVTAEHWSVWEVLKGAVEGQVSGRK